MIDPIVRTIDPKLVVVTMGPILITGYAPDTFLTIATEDDFFEKVRGADGSVERYAKNVYDTMITLTLLGTSLANDLLMVLHESDKLANLGKVPFLMKDLNGTTLATFSQAWIKKTPDLEMSNSAVTREWVIDTGPGTVHIGTNIL